MLSGACPKKYPNGNVLKKLCGLCKHHSRAKSAWIDYLEVLNIFGISQEQLRVSAAEAVISGFLQFPLIPGCSGGLRSLSGGRTDIKSPTLHKNHKSCPNMRSERHHSPENDQREVYQFWIFLVFDRSRLTWDLIWGGSWNFECPATKIVYLRAPMELW